MLMNTNHSEHLDEFQRRYDMTALILKLISEVYVILKLWHCLNWNTKKSAKQENLTVMVVGIFIMGLRDGMRIISQTMYSIDNAFPMIEVVFSVITLILLRPFFISSAKILLQRAPSGKQREDILECLWKIINIDGVKNIIQENFWNLDSQTVIGTVQLAVDPDSNADLIVSRARNILSSVISDITIEIQSSAEVHGE